MSSTTVTGTSDSPIASSHACGGMLPAANTALKASWQRRLMR